MPERKQVHASVSAAPCVDCRFFRLVLLPSGRFRRVCSFTGDKLPHEGAPRCDFWQRQGGDDAA